MKMVFKTITLQNFKSHRDLTVNFGEETKITADNAKGKSTLMDATPWLLYSTDALGSKLDPTPITYEAEETKVSLLFEVDGKDVLLGHSLRKGKAYYYINEAPKKAGEFDELVNQIFGGKELFLSLYNTNFFFSMKSDKQREFLLSYVPSPSNKEVLKGLPELQAEKLGPLLKKHSLEDVVEIHKENKNKKNKEYIAAQSRTKTLKEQLEQHSPSVAIDSIKIELTELRKQRDEIEKITDSAGDNNSRINVLNHSIRTLTDERDQMKEDFQRLKAEVINDTCRTCKQPLQDESLRAAEEDKEQRITQFKEKFNVVVNKRKELEEELKTLEYIDVSEQLEKARELQEKISPLEKELSKHKDYERLQEQVNQAIKDETSTLENLNESIFVLDSVKAFKAKEAEIQAEKVQALFETLSIRLFETQKNGEIKNTFEIEMDGKPYRKLSLSEGIRAGLELREVLSKQSEVIVPVFIDNAESITSFSKPSSQLITSTVVAGHDLKVEVTQ